MSASPPIVVSSLDLERIEAMLDAPAYRDQAGAIALRDELARADVLAPAQMPNDVVTMNSRVRAVDLDNGDAYDLTLVYPRDADGDAGRVSVLAPVGSAILGLRIGQTMQWPMPGGRRMTLRVDAIHYQPEAAGDLHR
ncbi:regulator of nucleoside diphosphate kinase [Dokdonella fugitiva]|uniref:Regulator of nucleoside diphosphate kinase n=1 Tax=Dokdonella fugitiva TaxID=328517 RepID=A0A839FB42_9GAMM|nr:nucleoside diphosphate kinase regulator [Dokdonella fugitiva]MBA8889324.1 regulator of nucleoside diphosphate kinase [Dokdonella fugitiva]